LVDNARVGSVIRAVLLADAAFTAAVAFVLLFATWDQLYNWLGIRGPEPAPPVQIAGALVLGLGLLLYLGSRDATLTSGVALAAAVANAVAALVIVVWFASGEGAGFSHGSKVMLVLLAAVFTGFAAAEGRAALRDDVLR